MLEDSFNDDVKSMPETIKDAKYERFKRALIDNEGYVSRAADDCNMARSTAIEWIRKDKRLKRLIKELRHQRRYGSDED